MKLVIDGTITIDDGIKEYEEDNHYICVKIGDSYKNRKGVSWWCYCKNCHECTKDPNKIPGYKVKFHRGKLPITIYSCMGMLKDFYIL